MPLDIQYSREIRRHLRYFPVWEPGHPVVPGALGELDRGVFHPQTSLAAVFPDLHVDIRDEHDPTGRHRAFQSRGCIQVRGKGNTELLAPGTAQNVRLSAEITFNREGAVVLDSSDLTSRRIYNLHDVRTYLSEHRDEWPRGYVLITHVEDAGKFGVVMSQSGSTTISLSGGSEAITKSWLVDADVTVHGIRDGAYSMFGRGPILLRIYGFRWLRRKPGLLSINEPIPDATQAEFCEIHANDEQFDE